MKYTLKIYYLLVTCSFFSQVHATQMEEPKKKDSQKTTFELISPSYFRNQDKLILRDPDNNNRKICILKNSDMSQEHTPNNKNLEEYKIEVASCSIRIFIFLTTPSNECEYSFEQFLNDITGLSYLTNRILFSILLEEKTHNNKYKYFSLKVNKNNNFYTPQELYKRTLGWFKEEVTIPKKYYDDKAFINRWAMLMKVWIYGIGGHYKHIAELTNDLKNLTNQLCEEKYIVSCYDPNSEDSKYFRVMGDKEYNKDRGVLYVNRTKYNKNEPRIAFCETNESSFVKVDFAYEKIAKMIQH